MASPFSKYVRNLPGALIIFILMLVALVLWIAYESSDTKKIVITCEWARLAPLPEDAQNVRATTEGGMFTRGFRVSFRCKDNETLRKWIQASPGLQDASMVDQGRFIHYEITPGDGAGYAEANINMNSREVKIYTYWS